MTLDDNPVEGSEEAGGSYDREAILNKLANLENFDMLKYVAKAEKLLEKIVSEGSSEPRNRNQENTDKGNPRARVARLRRAFQAVPDSMLHLMTGADRPGDCGRPSDQKPDWLDEKKLLRGQKFAQDHLLAVYSTELVSLFAVYNLTDGFKPVIITGKTDTPYKAFKRYLSVALRFRNWYTQDLWSEGTTAAKDFRVVRAMHAAVRRRLEASTVEEVDAAARIPNAWCPAQEILRKDFSEACEAPAIGQCPYMMEPNPDRPTGMNQTDMALAQWMFVGLLICYPKSFGVHYATEEEFEAYCHLWRCIGYKLGMEDEYNICRGTLEDVRHRSRDFLHAWIKPNLREITPEWEHMMRCLMSGVSVILPGLSYEVGLLLLIDILELPTPRFYASLSYKDWINSTALKSLLHHGMKLPGMSRLTNFVVNYVLDRAANFTPKELETVKIQLSEYPESKIHAS